MDQSDRGDFSSAKVLGNPFVLLGAAWEIFRDHGRVFVPIFFLPSLISLVGEVVINFESPALKLLGVLFSVAGLVFAVAMQPASVDAIHRLALEPDAQVNLVAQYKLGFRMFFPLVFVIILEVLAGIGAAFLFLVPLLILAIYASMYLYVFVLEGKRGVSVFVRSYELVKGRWWAVFGRLLFMVLVAVVSWLILAGLGFIISLVTGIGNGAVMIPLNLVGSLFIGALTFCYVYLLYLSLKSTASESTASGAGGTAEETASSLGKFKVWFLVFMVVGIIAAIMMGVKAITEMVAIVPQVMTP